jgi:hypothetical protein
MFFRTLSLYNPNTPTRTQATAGEARRKSFVSPLYFFFPLFFIYIFLYSGNRGGSTEEVVRVTAVAPVGVACAHVLQVCVYTIKSVYRHTYVYTIKYVYRHYQICIQILLRLTYYHRIILLLFSYYSHMCTLSNMYTGTIKYVYRFSYVSHIIIGLFSYYSHTTLI